MWLGGVKKSCLGCDIPTRNAPFCMPCKIRQSPDGRIELQEELGMDDGWVDEQKKGRKELEREESGKWVR